MTVERRRIDCESDMSRTGAPPWSGWQEAAGVVATAVGVSVTASKDIGPADLQRLLTRVAERCMSIFAPYFLTLAYCCHFPISYSESEFENCDDTTDYFYTPMAILSAHCIAANASSCKYCAMVMLRFRYIELTLRLL